MWRSLALINAFSTSPGIADQSENIQITSQRSKKLIVRTNCVPQNKTFFVERLVGSERAPAAGRGTRGT